MNAEQAKITVDYLYSFWPAPRDEMQTVAWYETFADKTPAMARAAIRMLADTQQFMPSHAVFCEAYAALARAERHRNDKALPVAPSGPRLPADANRARFDAARQLVAERAKQRRR